MKLEQYLEVIESFVRQMLIDTKLDGYVLGLSGGIDSALVAAIVNKATPNKLFALLMPCNSHDDDLQDALLITRTLNIPYQVIDLTNSYYTLLKELENTARTSGHPLDDLARANLKVRLRMVTLYAFAQARKSLVLGTDNYDEYYTGYFTKYGDGAVDLLPIVALTKGEVIEAASIYGVPSKILTRTPSAGLFPGQTDEGEMGVTYAELDRYLLGDHVNKDVKARIERLHAISDHKRQAIPRPVPYIRER